MSEQAAQTSPEGEGFLSLVIIIDGCHRGRNATAAANWLARRACRHGRFDVNVIDLAHAGLPAARPAEGGPRPLAVRELSPWLAEADAFVVVAPDGELPGTWCDTVEWFREEWRAKPVAFLTYGLTYGPGAEAGTEAGTGAGTGDPRTVARLRRLFLRVDAAPVPWAVAFPGPEDPCHGPPGRSDHANHANHAAETADAGAGRLLDELTSWARPLRLARAGHDA